MWLDRPPLCAEAQKTVRSTIDGTLKSYILICVRFYSPNKYSVQSAQHTKSLFCSLSLSLSGFLPPLNNLIVFIRVSIWLSVVHLPVCTPGASAKREPHGGECGESVWDFSHLESTHVSWIPCILQTVLIALEKELQEESEGKHKTTAQTVKCNPFKMKKFCKNYHTSIPPSEINIDIAPPQARGVTLFIILSKSRASVSLSSHPLTWVHGSFPTPICH